ncbi:MAG: cupin domain-containing protein [Phycisphaerae bacterium]|nr:cupin domain-containing protein [Phycisphaerae bacterium]
MASVKDIEVRKPTEQEKNQMSGWPVWNCEPSTFDWEYTEKETCLLIEGKVTVSDENGSVSFGAGDLVIFPKDLKCQWKIKTAVSKYYNFG